MPALTLQEVAGPAIPLRAHRIAEPKGQTRCQVAPGCPNRATHYLTLPNRRVLVPACVDCMARLGLARPAGVDASECPVYTLNGDTTERG